MDLRREPCFQWESQQLCLLDHRFGRWTETVFRSGSLYGRGEVSLYTNVPTLCCAIHLLGENIRSKIRVLGVLRSFQLRILASGRPCCGVQIRAGNYRGSQDPQYFGGWCVLHKSVIPHGASASLCAHSVDQVVIYCTTGGSLRQQP